MLKIKSLAKLTFLSAITATSSTLLAMQEAPSAEDRPNIILIVSDDHGSGDLGCYGNPVIHTPNLDALAEESMRFTHAYATTASCTSSRSVIQTGLYPHANGLIGLSHHYHNFRAFDHIHSLSNLLAEVGGYTTARVGKYHVLPEITFHYQHAIPSDVLNPVDMANQAKKFLESRPKNKPVFLYYATIDPHRSGDYVETDPYRPNTFHNRETAREGVHPVKFSPEDVRVPPYLPDNGAVRAELAQYYQSVARMDEGVGKLIEYLKDLDMWENSLVLYLTDNGIAFPGAKTNVYEAALRLPLIVKTPGGDHANSVTDSLVSWVDITPTLLDYAGILEASREKLAQTYEANKNRWDNTTVPDFQGVSFRPVLEDPEANTRDTVYASHTFHESTMYYPMRAIITKEFKLIWNLSSSTSFPHAMDLWHSATWQQALEHPEDAHFSGLTPSEFTLREPFELFDLTQNRYEQSNLADDPEFQSVLQQLKMRLKTFQQETADPWLQEWERQEKIENMLE